MPRGDGTGPRGLGPMSGRAAGFCAGIGMPGSANAMPGRSFGLGFGGGFGPGRGFGGARHSRRNRFFATGFPGWMQMQYNTESEPTGNPQQIVEPSSEMQKQMLKIQADALQKQLDSIMKRLDELETKNATGDIQ